MKDCWVLGAVLELCDQNDGDMFVYADFICDFEELQDLSDDKLHEAIAILKSCRLESYGSIYGTFVWEAYLDVEHEVERRKQQHDKELVGSECYGFSLSIL